VLITAASHRLISGLFVVEDTGAHQLKGLTQPVEILSDCAADRGAEADWSARPHAVCRSRRGAPAAAQQVGTCA
jgi:hypothetical protein